MTYDKYKTFIAVLAGVAAANALPPVHPADQVAASHVILGPWSFLHPIDEEPQAPSRTPAHESAKLTSTATAGMRVLIPDVGDHGFRES
jgi:hypothetical protein